jgi:hypothetical protein
VLAGDADAAMRTTAEDRGMKSHLRTSALDRPHSVLVCDGKGRDTVRSAEALDHH